jgi:hypothetical protein
MRKLKYFFIILFVLVYASCAHYNFIPKSAYLNDNSLYFNDSLKLSIQLPGDFILYSPKNKNGIRLKRLCKRDKKVLKMLGLNTDNSTILFAGAPNIPPFYNLICVLQDSKNDNISSTVSKQKIDGFDIATGTIQYNGKLVKLIYYNKPDIECPYCDIDSIIMTNSKRINMQTIKGSYYNEPNNCNYASGAKAYSYHFPTTFNWKKNRSILEVYTVDQADSSKKLYGYRLLDKHASDSVTLKLCPGDYLIKLRSPKNKTLFDTSVMIKNN